MKKRDLEEKLKNLGAKPTGSGSKHDKWIGVHGYRFTVPRHNEINENTAKSILRQAVQKINVGE